MVGWPIQNKGSGQPTGSSFCHDENAPRIRDLADKRLYVPGKAAQWPALSALIGGSIHNKLIEQQFTEVLRLAASYRARDGSRHR